MHLDVTVVGPMWRGGRGQWRAELPRGRVEGVKVWGRFVGPGWRLHRGPSPRESVLERKPCRGVRVRHAEWREHTDTKGKWEHADGERTSTRKEN